MDTRELRRGNWVLFEETGTEFEVEQIFANGLDVRNPREATYIESEYFAGIPLTKEWLLKLGFYIQLDNPKQKEQYENNLIFWIKKDDYIKFEFTNSGVNIGFVCYELGVNVRYVHQLQNLNFALLREELTIKEYPSTFPGEMERGRTSL